MYHATFQWLPSPMEAKETGKERKCYPVIRETFTYIVSGGDDTEDDSVVIWTGPKAYLTEEEAAARAVEEVKRRLEDKAKTEKIEAVYRKTENARAKLRKIVKKHGNDWYVQEFLTAIARPELDRTELMGLSEADLDRLTVYYAEQLQMLMGEEHRRERLSNARSTAEFFATPEDYAEAMADKFEAMGEEDDDPDEAYRHAVGEAEAASDDDVTASDDATQTDTDDKNEEN